MSLERKETEEVVDVVRAILVTGDGRVCVGKRSAGYEEDKWCLIGGKAESEDLVGELFREVEEELGVDLKYPAEMQPIQIANIQRTTEGRLWNNHYFVLGMDEKRIPEILVKFERGENREIRFVDKETAKNLDFAFGNAEVLEKFFERWNC